MEGDDSSKEKKINGMKQEIEKFFEKRKIKIKNVYLTCGENIEGFGAFNDHVAEMILEITNG